VAAGGTIKAIATRTIEGRDRLVLPGLVNAHTHSPLNILKGTGDVLSHPAFMWRNQADTAGRTPDEIKLCALFGCIEHLSNGTTAVIDHFPEQGFDLDCVEAVVDAYRIAGLRAVIRWSMMYLKFVKTRQFAKIMVAWQSIGYILDTAVSLSLSLYKVPFKLRWISRRTAQQGLRPTPVTFLRFLSSKANASMVQPKITLRAD
jgi:hypothetical protein